MTHFSFDSPRALISHARDEIEDARKRTRAFFEAKPYTKVISLDPETGSEIHKIRLTGRLPAKVSVIIKDAAGNLRDALDHAVYAGSCSIAGQELSDTGFPFARDAAGVKGELGGKRLRGNAEALRPILESFKPYKGGNDLLWGLNSIRNPNTHRMVVPVGAVAMGQNSRMANAIINGEFMFGYSHWDAAKNEVEFMRIGRGSRYNYEVDVAFDITFESAESLAGKPALTVLGEIASEVEGVVKRIEDETARILRERS